MAQRVLHPPCVRALIGQGKDVGMAEHGRVGLSRQACALVIAADHAPDRRPDRAEDAQRTAVPTKMPAERAATIAYPVHHSIPIVTLRNLWGDLRGKQGMTERHSVAERSFSLLYLSEML